MDTLELYAIKESTSSFTFLKEHLSFYLIVWLLVFIAILFLARFLINKAIKPTEHTLQSQKEFVASASHELKAPLAVILASAECIGNDTTLSLESNPLISKNFLHELLLSFGKMKYRQRSIHCRLVT